MQVASVQPGDEERVRHFLEGVVLEANTTLVSEQELFGNPPVDEDEPEPQSDAPEPSRDEELTGRFREFGRDKGHDDD